MKPQTRADLAMTAAVAFLGSALVFSGFSLLRLFWDGRTVAPGLGLPELLGIAAAGIGLALLGWWSFGLFCACLAAVAKRLGAHRLSAAVEGCSPAFMRRVVAAVAGLNLLAAPLATAVEGPGIDPGWQMQTVSTEPLTPAAGAAGAATKTTAREDLLPPAPPGPVDPLWVPNTPDIAPDLLIRPSHRAGPGSPGGGGSAGGAAGVDPDSGAVVVKSGDSLWSIVSEALGPLSTDLDVALAWPQWYSANRATIGADPNYILPGQILHAPGRP